MNKGFTLIEAIIAVSIGILIFANITAFLLLSIKICSRSIVRVENLDNIKAAANVMMQDIRNSDEVVPASNAYKLILYQKPDIIMYELKDEKIKRTVNASVQYLTPDKSAKKLFFIYPGQRLVEIVVSPYFVKDPIIIRASAGKQ